MVRTSDCAIPAKSPRVQVSGLSTRFMTFVKGRWWQDHGHVVRLWPGGGMDDCCAAALQMAVAASAAATGAPKSKDNIRRMCTRK